jgi:hypothetical protein
MPSRAKIRRCPLLSESGQTPGIERPPRGDLSEKPVSCFDQAAACGLSPADPILKSASQVQFRLPCVYYFFLAVVVIRHETRATTRWALLFIVRAFFNDTITVAVRTGFHVCVSGDATNPPRLQRYCFSRPGPLKTNFSPGCPRALRYLRFAGVT